MTRLLDAVASLVVYFLAATLVAELIITAYLWSAWKLDGRKLARMAAVAQGIEPPSAAADAGTPDEVPPEEVSHDEIIERRALLSRNLELRELALNNALAQLALQERALEEQQEEHRNRSRQFVSELKSLKETARAEGMEVVRSTLQSIKPSQAKEQLFEMLDNDEIDEAVLLLAEMPSSNRAKILAEFETEQENEKLAEVLRRIRQGEPEASVVDQAMNRLNRAGSILR